MRRVRVNILFIVVVILFCSMQEAIGQQLQTFLKYQDNGEVWLRWNPTDASTWEDIIKSGFVVEVYENGSKVHTSQLVQPSLYQPFELFGESENYQNIINQSIHFENVSDELKQESFPKDQYSEAQILESRYAMTTYLQNTDFALAIYAGLGYVYSEAKPRTNYKFKIISQGNPSIESTENFNSQTYTEADLPQIESKWKNRRVGLRWNTKEYKADYFGWYLEMSDNGRAFFPVDTNLIVNLMDDLGEPALHYFEEDIILEENDKTYYFRLYGQDYFGQRSENYIEISGQAKLGIGLSPTITTASQNKNNTCNLEWNILDEFKDQVSEYRLYAGPTWDGPYAADTLGLSPETFDLVREIPFSATYWRIAAVDYEGVEHSSFPKLIMARDTIAPAIPHNITSSITEEGVVNLSWEKNSEDDFIGYKVFYTHDTILEYVLAHTEYVKEPQFTDTLFLKTYQEYTYYKIISVDGRNNRSKYSEVIAVKKPDILPPVEPNFSNVNSLPGRLMLQWNHSSSPDVLSEQLFRKRYKSSDQWELIAEWLVEDYTGVYVDTMLQPDIIYAYTMTATDDDGNISDPAHPMLGEIIKDVSDYPVDQFELIREEEGNRISWDYPYQADLFEFWIYKYDEKDKPRLVRKVDPKKDSFLDKLVKEDETYTYFMRVYFDDGSKTPYSSRKTIER